MKCILRWIQIKKKYTEQVLEHFCKTVIKKKNIRVRKKI